MADFPLACYLHGDYGYKVLVVDDGDPMTTVVEKALDQVASVLVAPFPDGTRLKVKVQGADAPLADDATVSGAGLAEMEAIEIYPEA